jgi:hypothetical protein
MNIARWNIGGASWKRFAFVAVLAGMMLGVGAVPSQATAITHTFSDSALIHDFKLSPLFTFRVGFADVVDAVGSFTLTIEDVPVPFSGPVVPSLGPDYKCVQHDLGGNCYRFVASNPGGLPLQGIDFNGQITVGVSYLVGGWPFSEDPVDIGVTDNFSSFMVYAAVDPYDFRLVHFASDGSINDISGAHCGGPDINECARENGFPHFVVPEPATIGGVVWGLLGLTVLSRRLRRRI